MPEIIREYHLVMSEQRKLRQTGYAAITYTDHYIGEDADGRRVTGQEDFTLERWNKSVTTRYIYTPTGKRNKGGKMMWEYSSSVRARNVRDCGKIARHVMAGQEISIRQY